MTDHTNVNNNGANTQPNLIPFVTEKGCDVCHGLASWNGHMMSTNRSGQPIFHSIDPYVQS